MCQRRAISGRMLMVVVQVNDHCSMILWITCYIFLQTIRCWIVNTFFLSPKVSSHRKLHQYYVQVSIFLRYKEVSMLMIRIRNNHLSLSENGPPVCWTMDRNCWCWRRTWSCTRIPETNMSRQSCNVSSTWSKVMRWTNLSLPLVANYEVFHLSCVALAQQL